MDRKNGMAVRKDRLEEKDRLEVGGKRRMRKFFYKMIIANTFIFSFALTYKDELTLMVGASLRLASRQESFQDSRVGGLTSKGQVGVLLGEHRGWMLHMAALIKGRLSDNQTSDRKPSRLPFRR